MPGRTMFGRCVPYALYIGAEMQSFQSFVFKHYFIPLVSHPRMVYTSTHNVQLQREIALVHASTRVSCSPSSNDLPVRLFVCRTTITCNFPKHLLHAGLWGVHRSSHRYYDWSQWGRQRKCMKPIFFPIFYESSLIHHTLSRHTYIRPATHPHQNLLNHPFLLPLISDILLFFPPLPLPLPSSPSRSQFPSSTSPIASNFIRLSSSSSKISS